MPETRYVLMPLSKGQYAKVDPDAVADLSRWTWSVNPTKSGFYAHRQLPRDSSGKRKKEYMHRRIAGADESDVVDHINGDTLDNRRENLRVCSQSENMRNTDCIFGAIPFRGVHKRNGRYVAGIKIDGARVELGAFETAEEAAAEYDKAAAALFEKSRGLNGQRGRI